jgi:hypothetical protein
MYGECLIGKFDKLLPDRIKISKEFPTRDNATTIKDQYETKLVQFLSVTTKICVPVDDHRIENSGHIRGPTKPTRLMSIMSIMCRVFSILERSCIMRVNGHLNICYIKIVTFSFGNTNKIILLNKRVKIWQVNL